MEKNLRVAFFPDAYNEIDGVANTSRQFEAFARKRGLPFLTVCGGSENTNLTDGTVTRLMRRRGPIGFQLDKNHDFDFAFWRHYEGVENAVRKFDPDVQHITGPSDVGQLGTLIAHRLGIPLAASWHTNLHEYLEQRVAALFKFLPARVRTPIGSAIRDSSLTAILRFYRIARVLFAPNPKLMEMLAAGTRKPVYPMHRGVDTTLFGPRPHEARRGEFTIGYVGRLTAEKNVRFFPELEESLIASGFSNFRFLIVGQGAEEPWLRSNMRKADFTGVLSGEALASAYASMDVFVFPSRTDTFGNVVLEALASGVPAIVTDAGGPQFVVRPDETGFVARSLDEFTSRVRYLAERPQVLQSMREAARSYALQASWDAIFEGVYADYERGLRDIVGARKRDNLSPRPIVATPPIS
jgi:phosphatidylinositol alpha 1,6-mannosyltransferase